MPSFGQNLPALRALAVAEINATSGVTRQKYYTDLPGQDEIYGMKEAEAVRYLAETPDPEQADPALPGYPLIRREVGKTAPTGYEVAQTYVNKAHFWRDVLVPELEAARIGGIASAESAATRSEINAAIAAFHDAIALY